MTCRIGELSIDCADPERAAAFWCAALGYHETARDHVGVVIAGDPSAPTILLSRSSDEKRTKNRVHFDICPVGTTRDAEVARLEALGARRVDIGQGEPSWQVMVDPEGTEFCVMSSVLPPEPEPFHDIAD
jgi:catechol 2,3-dioxygenase-like lactoylglutathione lyase family enzyme